ncbi:YbeD family protein [Ralstonia solanacearum]|uniref:YbeD family protein n=1 Tax=Ralstonia solanacearum TaxID=305 RepID=UPI0018D19C4D|nr:YbeD family protein [Ralstonia solanacearum]
MTDANDTPDTPPRESLIEYPSDFPIKVMGKMQDNFAETIVQVVQQFDPEFHAGRMEMRPSSGGNYLGLTVIVRATSREQLDALYRALTSHPMVKVVL